MATEISVRMRYVLSGVVTEDNAREKEMPALSPYVLLDEHFNALHDLGESKLPRFDSYSMMKKQILALHLAEIPDFSSSDAMHSMTDLIVTKGIYDLRYRCPFRVQAVERVENDFESISTALANGYPLIANMIPGNFFGYQEHWEVFRAP